MKKQSVLFIIGALILLTAIFLSYNLFAQNINRITGKSIINNEEDVKTFTIEASNFKFTPNIVTVKKGDNVRIIVKNVEGMHSIHFHEDEGYDVEGNDVTFLADKAGTFEFHCGLYCGPGHDAMAGTLIVEE